MQNAEHHQADIETNVPCARCGGLRAYEMLQDGGMRVLATRCIHCGDITDYKILRHRRSRKLPRLSRPRTPILNDSRWRNRTPLVR